MLRMLEDIFRTDPEISVVGTARDGEEALSKIASLHPDVVTMDIEMPKMSGLTALRRIMRTNPLPVVMISTLTQREAQLTLTALEFGAVDYVPKPSAQSLNMHALRDELISKIKTAASANLSPLKQVIHQDLIPAKNRDKIISIAASTGGPPAVTEILKAFPPDIPPVLIVQHMPRGITKLFAERLQNVCKFRVKEAEDGDSIMAERALIAPGGFHMVITKERKVRLTEDPPVNYVRPSADVTMMSMAKVYGSKSIGVVLTGMGSDGARGIKAIKENGGFTIAQDEQTSVVFGMPKVAAQMGFVDKVAPLDLIPCEIMKACN